MAYTEIKKRNGRNYFYRVLSVRNGNRVGKKRLYLGANLSEHDLENKEKIADRTLVDEKVKKNLNMIKAKIIKVLKKYNIKKAGIFGSYARGDEKRGSDIDVIIEPPPKLGLKFVRIAFDLEEKLKKKVDLLTYNSIHPLLKKNILTEEVRII